MIVQQGETHRAMLLSFFSKKTKKVNVLSSNIFDPVKNKFIYKDRGYKEIRELTV